MNERDMMCSTQRVLDLTSGQQVQSHLHPEPCIIMGSTSNIPRSHVNQVLPPSGSVNNFDFHRLPEHVGRPAFYAMPQYNQHNHPATNHSNFMNLHLDPASGARVFPVPISHGFADHLPSSSNYGANAVPFNEHVRSNYPAEGVRDLCKRKNTDGIPGNIQHLGASAGPSSSSGAAMANCHFDSGSAYMDALPMTDYRGNGAPPMMEVGARNRSGGVGLHMDSGVHNYNNYLLQANYGGQSFQPSSCTWVDQQSISNAGSLPWSGPHPMMSYFQGSNVHGGSSELANSSRSGYLERSSNHGSANFLPTPPVVPQHHSLHPSQNIQGMGGYGVACYPPFLAAPTRVPPSDGMQHDVLSLSQESAEQANRPTGLRIYRSQGRNVVPDLASRRRDLPRLRTLQADSVALLEFSNYYEVDYNVENFIDHHSDMRLDIDDMSYEELLALSERIGTVNTGLTEKDIICHLKTKLYNSTGATFNLEELPSIDQDSDSCIICQGMRYDQPFMDFEDDMVETKKLHRSMLGIQDEYEDNDKLGTLDCGHDYHVDCLKKWLLLKNVCPICKSRALAVNQGNK